MPPLGGELLEQLAFLRVERLEERRLHAADRDRVERRVAPAVGEQVVRIVGPRRLGPVLHEPLAVAEERVRLLVDVLAGIPARVPLRLRPLGELLQELPAFLRVDVLAVPVRARREEPLARARQRDVGGAAFLVLLLRLELLLEAAQDAVVARQHLRVAAELEVHRLRALGRVVLDPRARQEPLRHPGHEHVVELQTLRGVDRHDLDGVLRRRLHRRPLLLVHALHHVHVVQERAERQLALDRFERVHLVHERREVPLGGGRRDLVRLGVQLRRAARCAGRSRPGTRRPACAPRSAARRAPAGTPRAARAPRPRAARPGRDARAPRRTGTASPRPPPRPPDASA